MSGSGITMPNGVRYRISSVRRYIVVAWLGGTEPGSPLYAWKAAYRTDDESKAIARWRKAARGYPVPVHVIDAKADDGPAVIR